MKQFIIILISFFISFASCKQKEINIELPFDSSKVTLNSIIEKDSLVYVRLTKTLPALSNHNTFEEIKNAKVDLYENEVLKETLKEKTINGKNYYTSSLQAKQGNRYTLKANGIFSSLQTSSLIPSAPEVLSFNMVEASYSRYNMHLKIKDEKGVKNYFMIRVYSHAGSSNYSGYTNFIIENIKKKTGGIFDDFKEPDPESLQIFTDEDFADKDEFTLILSDFSAENNYTLEFSNISEDYYRYLETLELQKQTESDPLREKVIIYSNIQGGLGILGAKSTTYVSFTP